MRRPQRFYSLNRPKLRQSWNKYNLYNLHRQVGREPQIKGSPTFFQQKWAAKAKTRAYHGEHIGEKKWVRMFSRRLLSAVDMPPRYLAAYDGSEQAAGRGSGLSTCTVTAETFSRVPKPSTKEMYKVTSPRTGDVNKLLSDHFSKMTPYMQMIYSPLERRLDTAIFRALFASSVRQARQFVIHGAVKVNGIKMVHPAYQLNPGDMFQVEVEKVMYGTGQQKKARHDQRLHDNLEARKKKAEALLHRQSKDSRRNIDSEKAAEKDAAIFEADVAKDTTSSLTAEEIWKKDNKTLKFLLRSVRNILNSDNNGLSAKEKKQLRLFRTDAMRFLARPERGSLGAKDLVQELQQRMQNHEQLGKSFEKFGLQGKWPTASTVADTGGKGGQPKPSRQCEIAKGLEGLTEEQKEKSIRIMASSQLSRDEMRKLGSLLQSDEKNPIDDSKPYATPWKPRPFMSAFAFIPRYLEVNPSICAAVYLRHPVARKGLAEVPTPFSYLTNQLAHIWYLERG